MANYSLVANSKFQPFSYQELAAPVMEMSNYHEMLNQEYDKLSTQADVLEAMGENDRDKNSKSYNQYKAYSDSLRKEADDLYRFGLNVESRRRLSDLRRRYNTDIVPIQNAWTKREKEADEQMKATLQNPSVMFTRDAANTSLDDYVKNPLGGYGVISGANITAQMAGMAKNLAKQIRSGKKENIDPYTYAYIEKHGLDENIIRDWQNYPTLKQMFEQVMNANGVTADALANSANRQSIIDKSRGYAEMGMWEAMGEDRLHTLENYGSRLAAQEGKEKRVAAFTHGLTHPTPQYEMPNIPSVGVGLKETEKYKKDNLEVLGTLKAGDNGLKRSIFGKTMGKVNPMTVYKEYQAALKMFPKKEEKQIKLSHIQTLSPSGTGMLVREPKNVKVPDKKRAKEFILKKYEGTGITDILSDEQYKALSNLGYSSKQGIKSNKFDNLLQDFNKTVELRSRYSTNMTKYDSVSDVILPNMRSRNRYDQFSGISWALTDDGSLGQPEKIKDLDLYDPKDNKDGNKVADVQYDPQFKGKIVLQLTDGSLHVVNPSIYNSGLENMITELEGANFHPQAITANIRDYLNAKNKVQGDTDSKIEF